ncbi:hypothetical protein JHW43_007776 [Diplocarpon mali]|nr:hypothetical protein JHW43_007776 [Diplocarpon mali]
MFNEADGRRALTTVLQFSHQNGADLSSRGQITGQSNFTGQVNGPCSVNFASSAMILLVVQIGNPGYVVETFSTCSS